MTDKIDVNPNPPADSFTLKVKEMDLDAGWLGKVFGSKTNAPMNIAGAFVTLLTVSGIIILFCPGSTIPAADFWKIIIPLLTLVMGYVFGKGGR